MNYPLFFALLSICSRGLAECFLPKSLAYLFSLAGFFLGGVLFYCSCRPVLLFKPKVLLISTAFIISAICSLLFTLAGGADPAYAYYLVYPVAISSSFLVFYSLRLANVDLKRVEKSVSVLVLLLFVVATVQEFKFIDLPGATPAYGLPVDLARPSSLTGSYLHYPLVMVMFGIFIQALNQRLTLFSLLAFASVFLAFSRSGMILVILHFTFLLAYKFLSESFRFSLKGVLVSFMGFFVFSGLLLISGFLELFWERLSSSFDEKGVGNDERINAWRHGVEVFSDSELWFGSNFGGATNLTSNLIGVESYVVESGVIQNLINFGIVGTLVFFLFFAYMYFYSRERIFRFFLLAFFFQSFVYQSTEVLPFILGVLFLRSIDLQSVRRYAATHSWKGR